MESATLFLLFNKSEPVNADITNYYVFKGWGLMDAPNQMKQRIYSDRHLYMKFSDIKGNHSLHKSDIYVILLADEA